MLQDQKKPWRSKLHKMTKTLKQIMAGIILGATCLLTPIKSDAQEISWYKNFSLGVDYEAPVIKKIDNIPEEIRDLPSKESYYNPEPIQDDDVETYSRLSFVKGKLGTRILLGEKANLKLGIALDWNIDTTISWGYYGGRKDTGTREPYTPSYSSSKALREIDPRMKCETTTDSGGGNSETIDYYYVHPSFLFTQNTTLRPSLFSELEFKIGEEKSLALGCEIYTEKINARTGYKRGTTDDVKDECELATLTIAKPYASFRTEVDKNTYACFDLGISKVINESYTDLGKQADFEFNSAALSAGIKISMDF